MANHCECGNRIMIYQKGKGMVPAPDKNHDLCMQCWDSLIESANR